MRASRGRFSIILASSLLLVSFALVSPSRAQNLTPGVNYKVESIAGGDEFCMDAKQDRAADGTPVFLYKCHGRANQRWTVTQAENNQVAIIGLDGYCLDVRRASNRDGTPVELWKCHFGANQRFTLNSDGRLREVGSGKCLLPLGQSDGAPIVLASCGMKAYEGWQFRH
jgi:hypothetical protein